MKRILLLLPFLFLTVAVQSQETLYLNKGTIVTGKVLEDNGLIVKIQVANGEVLEYNRVDIREIKRGAHTLPANPQLSKYIDYGESDRGYWTSVELHGGGCLEIEGKINLSYIEFQWINGYRLSEYFKIGVGLAGRYYITDNARYRIDESNHKVAAYRWSIPVFLNLRGNFIAQRSRMFAPYWSMDIGYAIFDNFFFSPTLGVRIGGARHNCLIGISYTGQIANFNHGITPYTNGYLNILTARVAYEF